VCVCVCVCVCVITIHGCGSYYINGNLVERTTSSQTILMKDKLPTLNCQHVDMILP